MGGVKANERVQSTNAAAGSTGLNTDVYKLNLQDMTCEIVVTTNPCPSPRTWASSAQVGSKVYLFGGRTYNLPELRYFNDIIVFDIGMLSTMWHSFCQAWHAGKGFNFCC
jgi:N-acetylneuraminic acid mutarotase